MKKRLDVLVTEKGLAPSREKAKVLIMAGEIFVDGRRGDKAGDTFEESVQIEHRGKAMPYVSRGGYKLEKAMKSFGITLDGMTCMDIGASTGGFTDCMLQNGAVRVYSIDVGYGQLAWKLREDPRVVCMEKTNVRFLTPDMLDDTPRFASIDVSFISLTLVLPAVISCLSGDGEIAALIKPQFEAGREKVGRKGVVRDPAVHAEVIEKILSFAEESGLIVSGLTYSPIKGPEGNIEYLVYLKKQGRGLSVSSHQVVADAHTALDKETI